MQNKQKSRHIMYRQRYNIYSGSKCYYIFTDLTINILIFTYTRSIESKCSEHNISNTYLDRVIRS